MTNPLKYPLNYFVFFTYGLLVAYVSLRQGDSTVIGSYDKLGHFLVYGLFAVLGFRLQLRMRHFLFLCLAIFGYSGLMEIGQSYVPGRFMSAADLLANATGILLGAALCRPAMNRKAISVISAQQEKRV